MEEKMTKKGYFELLKELVVGSENEADLTEFLDKQIAMLDAKSEKAKARAAEKKAIGDKLRDLVQNALTDELQTIDSILDAVAEDDEDATKAKVTARLSQLVKAGIAEKADVKNEDNKSIKAYKLV